MAIKKSIKKRTARQVGKKKGNPAAPADELQVTVRGRGHAVRRALTAMRFESEWNVAVARTIALDETLVGDATLDDKLGGPKLAMFSQDVRDLYRQRCVNEAAALGHPVLNPLNIPAGRDTKVEQVGDKLFENAQA